MSTVAEIKAAIETLTSADRAALERWLLRDTRAGDKTIPVRESTLDPEGDTPELEAELLKAADGPFTPYSPDEFKALGERIIRETRAAKQKA